MSSKSLYDHQSLLKFLFDPISVGENKGFIVLYFKNLTKIFHEMT